MANPPEVMSFVMPSGEEMRYYRDRVCSNLLDRHEGFGCSSCGCEYRNEDSSFYAGDFCFCPDCRARVVA